MGSLFLSEHLIVSPSWPIKKSIGPETIHRNKKKEGNKRTLYRLHLSIYPPLSIYISIYL